MGFELTTLVVIGTDCIGSYKSDGPFNDNVTTNTNVLIINDPAVYNKAPFQDKYVFVSADNFIFVCKVHYLFSVFDQRVWYQCRTW